MLQVAHLRKTHSGGIGRTDVIKRAIGDLVDAVDEPLGTEWTRQGRRLRGVAEIVEHSRAPVGEVLEHQRVIGGHRVAGEHNAHKYSKVIKRTITSR